MTTRFNDLKESNPLEYHGRLQRLAMAKVSRLQELRVRARDSDERAGITEHLRQARLEVEEHWRKAEDLRHVEAPNSNRGR